MLQLLPVVAALVPLVAQDDAEPGWLCRVGEDGPAFRTSIFRELILDEVRKADKPQGEPTISTLVPRAEPLHETTDLTSEGYQLNYGASFVMCLEYTEEGPRARLAKEEAGEGIAVRDPSETVAFRAGRSELDAFDAEWRERGFANRSQALNAVLRGRCGFLDVPRDLVSEFCAAWRQAKDVSDAGLVLAKAVHRGRLEVSEADRTVLIELLDLAQSIQENGGV